MKLIAYTLQVFVDIQQGVGNQLHPQLLDLVHDLELQLILVAKVRKLALAGKQRLRVQVQFVIQRAFAAHQGVEMLPVHRDRKSTRLNSSHGYISYAVFCLKKKKICNVYYTQY